LFVLFTRALQEKQISTQLHTFALKATDMINCSPLLSEFRFYPSLTSLTVECSPKSEVFNYLNSISQMKQLKKLTLYSCSFDTDENKNENEIENEMKKINIVKLLSNLMNLEYFKCRMKSDCFPYFFFLSQLPLLKHLILSHYNHELTSLAPQIMSMLLNMNLLTLHLDGFEFQNKPIVCSPSLLTSLILYGS
jgi:hypothetical protein